MSKILSWRTHAFARCKYGESGIQFITQEAPAVLGCLRLVEIDLTCNLEHFRRFLISSTCRSFIPESYLRDPEVFPEKEGDQGSIYVEEVDKVDLKKIRDITFINARDVLGIIYTSKSGNTKLKWRELRGRIGRMSGDASANSLVNLSMVRILSPEDVEAIMAGQQGQGDEMQGAEPGESAEAGVEAQAQPGPDAPQE
jgi:hypothetical protein